MRILLFTKMFPRIGNDSFGSYVYSQIKALSDLDVDLMILAPHTYVPKCLSVLGGKLKTYALAPEEYDYKELKVYSPPCLWARKVISNPNLKYYFFKLSIKKQLIKACRNFKPDVVYALDPTMEGRLCVEVCESLNIPVVLIEHSMPKFYNDLYGVGKFEKIYRYVAKKVDQIIFVSNKQKEVFEAAIAENIRGIAIINGFVREKSEERNPILNEKILNLICIGYLEERKGYPILFKALKKYKEKYDNMFHITIIGDGLDRGLYEQTVKDYDLSNECEFVGLISHQEVFQKLNSSDIFVLPSYGEALGIAYLEAMNCGLPIIGTENEGISDIVVNGENGLLIRKENVDDLCEAIHTLASNPERAREIAENGRKTVCDLTWENNAKQLKECFEKAIESNRRN